MPVVADPKTRPIAGNELLEHPSLSMRARDRETRVPIRRLKSVLIGRLDTPNGSPVGVLTVTNRKGRLEDHGFTEFDEVLMSLVSTKLAIAVERLKLLEARRQAICSRTHDLKAPLHAVQSILGNVVDGVYTLPRDHDRIVTAFRATKLLHAYIMNTLDLAQGRVDPGNVHLQEVEMDELLQEVEDIFSEYREQDGWCVNRIVQTSELHFTADRDVLFRILINLIDNAQKYGHVRARAQNPHPRGHEIEIHLWTDGPMAFIRVADHGPGISEELRARAFDVGGRLEGSAEEGRGIGLAAVRMLARALGGDAEILDRESGEPGTVVEVRWDQERLGAR